MEILRSWVQVLVALVTNSYWAFPFTRALYQGPLKVLCSPGLNCYSCPAAVTACPIGALQQLLAGVRGTMAAGQHFYGFYVVGSMGIFGAAFGRMICGWACPFGLIQEVLHKIPSVKLPVPGVLRHAKYGFLLFFVLLLPLFAVDRFGFGTVWFCKYVCPAGTLEAGIPMLLLQPELRKSIGLLFWSKFVIMIFYLGWSVFSSRPFCRTTCPLGAFYSLFNRFKLVRLRLHEDRCTQCQACHHVCPMGVKFNENPDDRECITCLACMSKACQYGAISLEIGGIPLSGKTISAPQEVR